MRNAKLANTILDGANLSGTDLNQAVEHLDPDMRADIDRHVEWVMSEGKTGKRLSWAGKTIRSLDLSNLDFTLADLTGMEIIGVKFRRAYLTGADFTGSRLEQVDLTDADMRGANMTDTKLKGVNLPDARLEDLAIETRDKRRKTIQTRMPKTALGS